MDQNPPASGQGQEPNSGLPAPRPSTPHYPIQHAAHGGHALALPSVEKASDEEEDVNLLEYWHILVKRKWHILAIVLFALAWGFIFTLLSPRIYRATTTVQIQSDVAPIVDMISVIAPQGGGFDGRDFYQTQFQLIRSRALAERVASDLGLMEGNAIEALATQTAWQKIKGMLFGKSESSAETPTRSLNASARAGIAAQFGAGINVAPVGNSQLAQITYDSPDPIFSVRAANAVADGYVTNNLERRFDSSAYAKTFLEERLEELRIKLEESERKLVQYAQAEGIVSGTEKSLDEQNLTILSGALVAATQERIRAEAQWRQAEAKQGVVGFFANLSEGNEYLRNLQESRAKLKMEYQDKLRIYKPGYPLMEQLNQQIEEVDRQIAEEVGEIRASIKSTYDAAVAQEASIKATLQDTKVQALDTQNRSIQYTIFEREVDTNRELYQGLLQRYKEVDVAGGVKANNISIVDRATGAGMVAPNMRRNLSLALFAGIAAGVLLALLLEYLDDTIKTPRDVEIKLKLAHLGLVPKLGKNESVVKAEQDVRSAFAESYRSLRTALQFSTESGVPAVLVVTSSTPGEGKSTTARMLAQNLAQLGKRVLLIDSDLRNPSLHRTLGLDNSKGLSTCLSGGAKPAECIHPAQIANLFMLPSGPLPPSPAELLSGPRMLSLLTQASERYDHVILDAPPVLGLADAPILASMSHGTLFVVESGRSRVSVAQSAIKRLYSARARLLGAVLTKFDAKSAGYGYGYGSGAYAYLGYEYYGYGSGRTNKQLGNG